VPADPVAQDTAVSEAAVSTAVHRTSFVSELEPDGWQNVLWVAKQHGHSIVTMLRIYAAWAEGAVEADVEAIKRSMNLTSICRESPALNNLA
jgi:hypothetical protein